MFIFWSKFLPKKGMSGVKEKIRLFACIHGCCLLLYYNFMHVGRQIQRYFNVSARSGHRDNKD